VPGDVRWRRRLEEFRASHVPQLTCLDSMIEYLRTTTLTT
jgi:hypothetical protein